MYRFVTDKEFLGQTHRICADLVNQLVQELRKQGIEAGMSLIGSGRRRLITQNGKGSIDYDYNLLIQDADRVGTAKEIKEVVIEAFKAVLKKNGRDCYEDSTSSIATERMYLETGNQTPFKIDIGIIKTDRYGNCYRLIHRKHDRVQDGEYYWNQACNMDELHEKEDYLKPDHWEKVRRKYLDRKNLYLCRNDHDHPSFICYKEAVNDVYNEVRQQEGTSGLHNLSMFQEGQREFALSTTQLVSRFSL